MKTNLIIILSFLSMLLSCQNSDWKLDEESIRPIQGISEKEFKLADFGELNQSWIDNFDVQNKMNHSDFKFGVALKNKKLVIAEPTFSESCFQLEDGKLEIINHGEFGGALNFIPNANLEDTISIIKVPIKFVFNFKGEIYFVTGIAHMFDSGGAILKLTRTDNKFEYTEVIRLDSAPCAMTIYQNKILVAGHNTFTVIENFKKENIIINPLWSSLYPNSIAVINNNEVYVGFRDGYAKLSLNNKKINYFMYKKPNSVNEIKCSCLFCEKDLFNQ